VPPAPEYGGKTDTVIVSPSHWEKTPHGLPPVEVLCRTTSPEVFATFEYEEPERLSA